MTDIKTAIIVLKEERKYHPEGSITRNSLDTAISSMYAWEEILTELEELKQNFKNDKNIHAAIAVNISIKRIKEKLAEFRKEDVKNWE